MSIPLEELVLDQSGDSEVLQRFGSQLSGLRHGALEAVKLVFLEFNVDAGAHRVDIKLFIYENEGTGLFVITSNLYRDHLLASVLEVVLDVSNDWFKRVLF